MAILSFDLSFEFLVDTETRQKRVRCTIVAPPEVLDGWEWPAELPRYTGLGTSMEEAIINAITAYRDSRG